MKQTNEANRYKSLGFVIPNEKDGIIKGQIIHTDVESIEKANAKLREQFDSMWVTP